MSTPDKSPIVATLDQPSRSIFAFNRSSIGWELDSITYNTYLDRYVMVGVSGNNDGVWGAFYAYSPDLIQWTTRELLIEKPLAWTVANSGSDLQYLYFSLIDPESDSMSFETSGQTAYLYYTRLNHGQASLDRDLVRVKVEFTFTD